MLIQNQYDGRFYEVPEVAGYGEYAGPGYHGLGIPFLPIAAKIGARLLPRALPYARRFLRRFRRRFPGIRRLPFMPGFPPPGGVPPIPSPLLSTNVARKVVSMLRQQGLQVMPAQPPGPEPAVPPPGAEPQPGVGEYPYDPQAAASEESDPYAEQETYPYQHPYQYPYASMSPWQQPFSRWRRRYPGWRGRRSYSWARPGAWAGRWTGMRANVVRRHATARRAAPAYARPAPRGRR